MASASPCASAGTNPYFDPVIRSAGLDHVAIGTVAEHLALMRHPDLWHPRKGLVLLLRHALSLTRETCQRIAMLAAPAHTVLGAPRIALGARLAQEALKVPLATLVINPMLLREPYIHRPNGRACRLRAG